MRFVQNQQKMQGNNDVENPRTTNLSGTTNQTEQNSSRRGGLRWIGSIIFTLISLIWTAVFVFAALDKTNDWPDSSNGLHWIIFEILNAVVPASFLIYYWTGFLGGIFSFLATVGNVWAIVYLVMIWMGKEWNSDIQFWAYLGMASTLYHSLVARFFVNRTKQSQ